MMLNCDDATLLMSEGEDRELTRRERIALTVHKSMCRGCRNFDRQLPRLRAAARRFARLDDDAR